jgi:hypothetical protein
MVTMNSLTRDLLTSVADTNALIRRLLELEMFPQGDS